MNQLAFFGLSELIILIIVCFILVLPMIALAKVTNDKSKKFKDKVAWILLIILIPVFGPTIYLLLNKY